MDYFNGARSMESFILAAALRMVGATVQYSDAELQEPYAEAVQPSPDGSPHGVPSSTNMASGSP